jgi:alkylmercury lyase-like protein
MAEPASGDSRFVAGVDSHVRQAVYAAFARGQVPSRAAVAVTLRVAEVHVAESYERLAAGHVLVLQPDTREVWMAMPFSAVPTPFKVEGSREYWWANCAWDALGVPVALEIDARIRTRCAYSDDPIDLHVEGGLCRSDPCVAHFAVPARRWWDDIGFT